MDTIYDSRFDHTHHTDLTAVVCPSRTRALSDNDTIFGYLGNRGDLVVRFVLTGQLELLYFNLYEGSILAANYDEVASHQAAGHPLAIYIELCH